MIFKPFPKMARLNRDCLITEKTTINRKNKSNE